MTRGRRENARSPLAHCAGACSGTRSLCACCACASPSCAPRTHLNGLHPTSCQSARIKGHRDPLDTRYVNDAALNRKRRKQKKREQNKNKQVTREERAIGVGNWAGTRSDTRRVASLPGGIVGRVARVRRGAAASSPSSGGASAAARVLYRRGSIVCPPSAHLSRHARLASDLTNQKLTDRMKSCLASPWPSPARAPATCSHMSGSRCDHDCCW